MMLSRALSPHCSGLLVDGYYGYGAPWPPTPSRSQHGPADPGREVRGRQERGGAPLGEIEPGWGVAKIKRCGADAVKLLAQFEPDEPDSAEHNFELTRQVYEECIQHDILFLLEPIHFPYKVNGEKKSDERSSAQGQTVIESAKFLSRYCDVYKAEFPGTLGVESDIAAHGQPEEAERRLREAVGAACRRAWTTPSTRSRSRWR